MRIIWLISATNDLLLFFFLVHATVNVQRLEHLRCVHNDTYKAVVWLRENKGIFKGEIHKPMMLTVGFI